MKKIFILFFALITSAVSMFASVEINGIAYNLNTTDLTAEVTKKTEKYSGDVIIPESVTYNDSIFSVARIATSAFSNCQELTSVTIPNSITSIGKPAFDCCTALVSFNVGEKNANYCSINGVLFSRDQTELLNYPLGKKEIEYIIPNSVTSIGYRAFFDCLVLTSIIIPHSVTTIGEEAFRNCAFKSITIPNSVTKIGRQALYCCRNLTSITIPNSVTSIGDYAFSSCISLTNIQVEETNPNYCAIDGVLFNIEKTFLIQYPSKKQGSTYSIPNSVTRIGYQAFFACTGLTYVNIPNSVISIGSEAFRSCSKLDSITIPNSVTTIENYVFEDCSRIRYITIPSSVTKIGWGVFYDLKWMTCEAVNPPSIYSNTFKGWISKSIPIYVPAESVDAYKAANYWKEFTNIKAIPETSPWILASGTCGAEGDNLTWEVSSDNILTIKGSGEMKDYQDVDSIPWGSLNKAIKKISLPQGMTNICNYAFFSCERLPDIVIPNSVTSIGNQAFSFCEDITSITIPNSVTNIQKGVFSYCDKLTSVTLGNSVANIGSYAFKDCSSLISITIPNSVIGIYSDAFLNCSSLTSIKVDNENLKYCSVDGVLFTKDKTALVTYPAGIQGPTYTIPNSVTRIESYAFGDCNNLTSITIPNSVKYISHGAFSYCQGLTSVTIPDSVTIIGNSAFYYCSGLTSVTIPNSVKYIQAIAFYNCSNLTSFTCKAVTPPSIENNNAFYNVDKSIPVYVPAESIEAYKAANVWKEFTNIQAIAGFDPEHPANPGSYQLTLVVEDTNKGYTTGSGLYEQGATAHIEAIARDGYQFVCWSDNDSNAVRDIVIIRDSTLTASFTEALGDDTVYVDFPKDLDDLPIGKNTNVIITPYGRLNITRPIAIKSLMIEKDTAFGQVSGVDMLQAESVEVMHYFYRHIDEGSYRWFAFSVPFTVSVAEGIFMNEAHDVARYGVDFVIDEYDGHLRATTQEGWKRVAANATLYPGKFYMIASKQANIWYFKALDPSTAFDAEPFAQITAYSSAIGDHHAGWNGIANKQFVNANLQATTIQYATTYNNYYGVYSVMPLTNYMTERPGMPFFVQASEHDTIEFRAQPEPLYTDGGIGDPIPADAPSRLRRAHESRPFVLSIGNSEYTDKAYVDLAADKEDRYTIGEDLIKMQTSKPTVPQIWINAYDAHLAAYAMPAESEKSAIELGISTPQEGTYTLSFDNVPQGMTMFISKDGEHLYPLSNGEYEIYLEKGVNTNYRIEIYRTPSIYTDIENINSSKGHCKKMIKDGKLYLLYEGTMYNVQGVKVIDK